LRQRIPALDQEINELSRTLAAKESEFNVNICSNGAGKSHLLKLCYTVARWSQEMALRAAKQGRPDKAAMQKELGGKLVRVFRPDQLGRSTSRSQGRSKRAEVGIVFARQPKAGFKFSRR
jgi:ABC-type uncharacterized transport system ATPase component